MTNDPLLDALRAPLAAAAWEVLSAANADGTLLDELEKLSDIAIAKGRSQVEHIAWAQGYRHGYNRGLKAGTEAAEPDEDPEETP